MTPLDEIAVTPRFNSEDKWVVSDDWGEVRVVAIDDGDDFWHLMDALIDDGCGFWHNRRLLVNAFKNGNLFGLKVSETDSMINRRARKDAIFCPGSRYLLPCLCMLDRVSKNTVVILWTHTKARRNGFGSILLRELKVDTASHPLPGTNDFWRRRGIACEQEDSTILF